MKRPLCAGICLLSVTAAAADRGEPIPRVWAHYSEVESAAKDFADMLAHGVGMVNSRAGTIDEARKALEAARRAGMKYNIAFADITEHGPRVRAAGREPSYALMIGGVFQGKAIDRHLFRFTPGRHDVVIEPPVYNPGLPYTRGSKGAGKPMATDPIGHYWPDMPAPLKAEIVVPLGKFDGQQHLKIVTAEIGPAAADDRPEHDTTAGLPDCPEIRNRKLYRLRFDLSGLDGALLDHVGIAVYWPYLGTDQYWLFGRGFVSASAETTRQTLRDTVRKTLGIWSEANGGRFPNDVVKAARFGDESFYLAGHTHLNSPAVSYPLWDASASGIQAFEKMAGRIEYPRTWGFPEIYGPDAYAWWMYSLHKNAADLAGIAREEISKLAPGLVLFRNTTRGGVFSVANDRDGSGPELLTRQLDLIHLDPYPVSASGYTSVIPRDMSYYAGLARRYRKPLVPWMQAHTYTMGKEVLQHVTPAQIDRMAEEHLRHGVDAVVWLGYCPDCTFPKVAPESWERAAGFHKRLARPPRKPRAHLAVLRGYRAWSATSLWEGLIRNPADWQLQQLLEVWAVRHGQAYDVFELPPRLTPAGRSRLAEELKGYRYVVSTEPWEGAWIIGGGTAGQTADPGSDWSVQRRFEEQLRARGWLTEVKR